MALKLAIDREEILNKILRGYGTLGNDFPVNAGRPTQDQTYSTTYLSTMPWNDTHFFIEKFEKLLIEARRAPNSAVPGDNSVAPKRTSVDRRELPRLQ
ncbi:hypothetical protein BQ8794_360002 [Mesorhizobium prunaredense]|uniref:Uncharacterized protein n=1 Tax=Mesorhizobium prunaredense TaxID=1631249 RepID=A0A1R3VBW0_9HYPH|nr:hypothetical protein BQ8794_360002 [Mesorhizobium prunaredense]